MPVVDISDKMHTRVLEKQVELKKKSVENKKPTISEIVEKSLDKGIDLIEIN